MATKKSKTIPVDTDRIRCVIHDIQDQLRALVYIARTDTLEEPTDGEVLRTMCENIGIRAHVMLDECLSEMGESQSGNFHDSFADLDERRGVVAADHDAKIANIQKAMAERDKGVSHEG